MAISSIFSAILAGLFVVTFNANAELQERPGGMAYYDTEADLTWFADGWQTDHDKTHSLSAWAVQSGDVGEAVVSDPVPDIKANGSDGPLDIALGTLLQLDVSLSANDVAGQAADWWLAAEAPDGWYWYNLGGSWVKSAVPIPTYGGSLYDITSLTVLNSSNLPDGSYRIYFGVDTNANGVLNLDVLFADTVDVYIYRAGDTGPGGGIVFYRTDGGAHGLEAAPVDQTNAAWGCAYTPISGADGTAVGTGAQNTADIVAGCTSEVTAADVADGYTLNGYDDWFLPSKDELNLLYQQKNIVGGFADEFYWSSSENDNIGAWFQDFTSGGTGLGAKGLALRVRAVRAF